MRLSTKFLSGFTTISVLYLILFFGDFSSSISPISYYLALLLDLPPNPFFYFVFGVVIAIVGIFFYYLLFIPEKIKGHKMEFEVSPDLTSFQVVKEKKEPTIIQKEVPEIAHCSACGKKIHKPFRCNACGQLLCGSHYLPGDHQCTEGN
jgi:hypothetical protein